MIFGYARVSTTDQSPDLQFDALEQAGYDKLFVDKASGAKSDRPQYCQMLEQVRSGDVILIWKLDRLGRSLRHLLEVVDRLNEQEVILVIHGGGWHGGDKAAGREQNIGTNLARAGYVCASVNYVLAEKRESFVDNLRQVWPRNLQECMTAVRFLRANADKYHINPKKIGAIGGSAGGHLVSMLAFASDADGLDPKGGPYAGQSCRIQAVVPMYGVYDLIALAEKREMFAGLSDDDKALCRAASAVSYLDSSDPPALLLHGTRDALVPVRQSEILHAALEAAKLPSELHIIEGAKHSFHLEPPQKDLRPLVIEFFNKHLK